MIRGSMSVYARVKRFIAKTTVREDIGRLWWGSPWLPFARSVDFVMERRGGLVN